MRRTGGQREIDDVDRALCNLLAAAPRTSHRALAAAGLNILGQHLKTDERTGYVITDVDRDYDPEALHGLEGEQVRITRARGDERDKTSHAASAIKWKKLPVARPPLARVEPVSATGVPFASVTAAKGASGWSRMVE